MSWPKLNTLREKAKTLADVEGFDDPFDLAQENAIDSVNPGICLNPDCCYTTEVEPDQREGWCEECDTQSVCSITELMLAGAF